MLIHQLSDSAWSAHVLGDDQSEEVKGSFLQNTGVMLPSFQGEALAPG